MQSYMKPLADQCCGAAATVGGQDYLHTLSENRGKEKQSDGTTILTSHMKLMYTNFPSTLEGSGTVVRLKPTYPNFQQELRC